MIRVNGISISLDHETQCRGGLLITEGPLITATARILGIEAQDIKHVEVIRRNVDARRKHDVHFVVNAAVELRDSSIEQKLLDANVAQIYTPYQPLDIPNVGPCALAPVVVGTGPAGLFAALYLARAGAKPVVLERGPSVDERADAIAAFVAGGPLNEQANIQFGEGGAGTFSDGKLTTNIKHAMRAHVPRWFVQAGAPASILWDGRPHIGSDRLPSVVAAMRDEIIQYGGQVLFNTQLVSVKFEEGRVVAVEISDHEGTHTLRTNHVVLACGHSARDTFAMLHQLGIAMEQKSFSVGVRIEHKQECINDAQWGQAAQHPALGAAEYKLAFHDKEPPTAYKVGAGHNAQGSQEDRVQRSAYTFCMCPGGTVLCASSEAGGVATNGMSTFSRDGENANAGLLVNVDPVDFGSDDPLAGVRLQQSIEQRAFDVALAVSGQPYTAPAQTVEDFMQGTSGNPSSTVQPTYTRGVAWCDLHDVLPSFVCNTIARALPEMDRRLKGFADPDAVMTAPEARSSSPVRICRAKHTLQAWVGSPAAALDNQQPSGLYPCGEGAGHAGGIMSAACDGLLVAARVASDLQAEGRG